jgi:hypothetical protein
MGKKTGRETVHVLVELVRTGDACVATAQYMLYTPRTGAPAGVKKALPWLVEAIGTSKRHGGDKDVPVLGEMLAVGRAVQALSQKLQRLGHGFVKHIDDVDRHRGICAERKVREAEMQEFIHEIPEAVAHSGPSNGELEVVPAGPGVLAAVDQLAKVGPKHVQEALQSQPVGGFDDYYKQFSARP